MWKKEFLEHRMKEVQLYEKNTKDPPKVRQAAAKFLEKAIRNDVLEWPQSAASEAIAKEGKQVLADGSQDPLVTAYVARLLEDVPSSKEQRPLLMSAIQGLAASTYPAELQLRPLEWLRAALVNSRTSSAFQPHVERFVATAARLMADAVDRPEDRRVLWELLSPFMMTNTPFFIPFQNAMADAATKDLGKVDPWTLNMIAGAFHIRMGWNDRGGGYQVTPAGSESFEKHLKLAAECLVRAWKLDPKQPAAPYLMIRVAMGGGSDESPREWFDRAVAAQMDYEPAYFSLEWALRPRWGGSHSDMYKFGRECLATKRFDTIVPYHLIKVAEDIDEELGKHGDVWQRSGVYDDAKAAFEGLEKDFPGRDEPQAAERLAWLRSVHAAVAIRAKQEADARKPLENLDEKHLRRDVFITHGLTLPYHIARVFALTGDAKDQVVEFEKLMGEKKAHTAEGCLAAAKVIEAAASKDSNVRAKPFFDFCKIRVKWQEQYDKGEWVSLTFDPAMAMWQHEMGNWTVENEHSVLGTSEYETGGYLLICNAKFSESFEIECDVEVLSTWGGYPPHSGVIVRAEPFSTANCTNLPGDYVFWFRWPNNKFGACQWNAMKYEVEGSGQPKGHLVVRVWKDAWEYYVNGLPFSFSPIENFSPTGAIALGSATFMGESGQARFSNLRIRKLASEPPPPATDPKAQIRFYTESLRQHPEIAVYYYLRGNANTNLGRVAAAIADLEKAKKMRPDMTDSVDSILGLAYENKGDYAKASELFQRVVKAKPDWSSPRNSLAWLMATCPDAKYRDGAAAVKYATQICELSRFEDWGALDTLAAAHAEAGNFDEAVKREQQALDLAPDPDKPTCQDRIALYEAKKPFRQPKPKADAPKQPRL